MSKTEKEAKKVMEDCIARLEQKELEEQEYYQKVERFNKRQLEGASSSESLIELSPSGKEGVTLSTDRVFSQLQVMSPGKGAVF